MADRSPPATGATLKKKAGSIKEALGKLTGDKVTQVKGTAQKAEAEAEADATKTQDAETSRSQGSPHVRRRPPGSADNF